MSIEVMTKEANYIEHKVEPRSNEGRFKVEIRSNYGIPNAELNAALLSIHTLQYDQGRIKIELRSKYNTTGKSNQYCNYLSNDCMKQTPKSEGQDKPCHD
jgi:hypothetical protein